MSKDVKRMVAEIRQSLEAYPREQLVEILSYVFKEYVVEGAAPIAGTTALIDARTELEGLSFAELMTWLQLHLDVPELAQFEVQGTRVFVRSGGRALPVEAQRIEPPVAPVIAPPAPQPSPPPVATPSVTSRPMPSAPPTPSTPQSPTPSAPPPSSATPSSPAPSATPPANPAQPASEKKEESGTSASRFSWLEVD